LYRPQLEKYLATWIGDKNAEKTTKTIIKIEQQLGSWVRGELVLMAAVGILTYIGLVVLGIDTALPLAILAGLLEIVPNIGPTLSAIPAILIALTIHPLTAAATVALYFIVQFLENNLLVPKIMQKAVGVNPILSIVGLMIGVRIAGAAGALLAIPVTITIQAILPEIANFKNNSEK
jgi:predicted PurR-regulated permease PerM